MPNISTITLPAASLSSATSDEAYTIIDRREGVSTFRYNGGGPLALATRFTVAVKQPHASSKYARVTLTLVKPEKYTDNDTSLQHQSLLNRATLEFQVDKTSTSEQILAIAERMLAFLQDSNVTQSITNVEGFY